MTVCKGPPALCRVGGRGPSGAPRPLTLAFLGQGGSWGREGKGLRVGDRLPLCWGSDPPWQAGTHGQKPGGFYSRSVPVRLDGVDTVLAPAPTLKEGTVFLELQVLAREVAALEDF